MSPDYYTSISRGKKLLSRNDFRAQVFERDDHKCVICREFGDSAHHVLDRKLFVDGGYYLDNGATVCDECHLEAEKTLISVEEIRKAAGIKSKILPPDFSADQRYDKWGSILNLDGTRTKGRLFDDVGCQTVLKVAGLFHLYK